MSSLRKDVIDHVRTLSNVNDNNNFIFRQSGKPTFFVKYGDEDALVEAKTQMYFYDLAQHDDSAPRIPKVYDVFDDSVRYYSVMEYVEGQTLETAVSSEVDAVTLATSAIRWLLNQKLPPSEFGTIASSDVSVRHHFFKDDRAPVAFANARALQAYVNKVCFYVDCFHRPFKTSPTGHFAHPTAQAATSIFRVDSLCDLSLRHQKGQLSRRRKPSRLDDRLSAHRRAPTAVLPVRLLRFWQFLCCRGWQGTRCQEGRACRIDGAGLNLC